MQNHLSKPTLLILQNVTPREICTLTSQPLSWTCLLYCACHGKCVFADHLQMSHACHLLSKCCKTLMFFLTVDKIHNLVLLPRETTSEPPKVVRTPSVLTCWLQNVLRATTACTFSRSELPKVVRTLVFLTFWLRMCFAPQRRALFRHLNCQKWSAPGVLCTCWFRNVLCATTACTFSTSQLPKVVRTPSVFNILTSKCASRHNSVHFFEIWTSKSGPNP